MHMQVVWGRILPDRWSAFAAAYKEAIARRGEVRGLRDQWLLRAQNDPDAGYSISLWESEADMQAYWQSPGRAEGMALLQPFFANQYTITHCEVRMAVRGAGPPPHDRALHAGLSRLEPGRHRRQRPRSYRLTSERCVMAELDKDEV